MYDEDFVRGRLFLLLCSKICVVKNKWTKGGFSRNFQPAKKKNMQPDAAVVPRAVFYRVDIFSLFHMGISLFKAVLFLSC